VEVFRRDMSDTAIEQAIYGNPEPGGFRFLARSPGFRAEWLSEAERLCTGFGNRPKGIACPTCVFAQPFGPEHVAIVQVADLGTDDAHRPGAIGFRLLVLRRELYEDLTGDPFLIADTFPPRWTDRDVLPVLSWPERAIPQRTVAEVQKVLKNGDSATLLGGVQALIDSGRLVFERPAPDTDLLRRIWLLLPTSTRSHLWPASFAFANTLGFDVLVVPRADLEQYAAYVREEQAGDYPEGRYELNLQIAAEAGDQAQLDSLFSRRSSAQTLRLGIILLVVVALLAVVMNVLQPPRRATPSSPRPTTTALPPVSAPQAAVGEPALEADYPPVADEVGKRAGMALRELILALGPEPAPEMATLGELLETLGERLASPTMPRESQKAEVIDRLAKAGKLEHPEARVRAWLWLYGVQDHADPRHNLAELVDRLGKKVVPPKLSNPPPP
jgi:hypothetical protein